MQPLVCTRPYTCRNSGPEHAAHRIRPCGAEGTAGQRGGTARAGHVPPAPPARWYRTVRLACILMTAALTLEMWSTRPAAGAELLQSPVQHVVVALQLSAKCTLGPCGCDALAAAPGEARRHAQRCGDLLRRACAGSTACIADADVMAGSKGRPVSRRVGKQMVRGIAT